MSMVILRLGTIVNKEKTNGTKDKYTMLVALTASSETPTVAPEASKDTDYICPHCKHPLQLRQGSVKIHHFAHKTLRDCPYGSGETELHMRCKILMHNILKSSGFPSVLEKRMGNRIADIALGENAVVELQHSSCNPTLFQARIEDYHRLGKHQLWVMLLNDKKLTNILLGREITIDQTLKWFYQLNFNKAIWVLDDSSRTLLEVSWKKRTKTKVIPKILRRIPLDKMSFKQNSRKEYSTDYLSLPTMNMLVPHVS